jgi:uncharacterized protein YjhX (UPF0386 family)
MAQMHSVSIEWHRDVVNSTLIVQCYSRSGIAQSDSDVILAVLLKTSSFPWVRTVSRSNNAFGSTKDGSCIVRRYESHGNQVVDLLEVSLTCDDLAAKTREASNYSEYKRCRARQFSSKVIFKLLLYIAERLS